MIPQIAIAQAMVSKIHPKLPLRVIKVKGV